MIVEEGKVYKMRDGTLVEVTNAADQDPDAYRWYAEDEKTINAELPVETIFVGHEVKGTFSGEWGYTGNTVVSDMSEVVALIS